MDKWKTIWNKKDRVNNYVLETLIKADGFDSGAGSFTLDDWTIYTKQHFDKLNIKDTDSIYDVGCGCGAFVYPLYLIGNKIGGGDYSSALINLANTVMQHCHFEHVDAIKIGAKQKYDIVLSHSVFHYFKDLDYAENVILNMLEKANKK